MNEKIRKSKFKVVSIVLICILGGLSGALTINTIFLMGKNNNLQLELESLQLELNDALEQWELAQANYEQAYQDYLNAQANYEQAYQDYLQAYQDYLEAQANYEQAYQDYLDLLALYQVLLDRINEIEENTDFSGSFYTTISYKVYYDNPFYTRETAFLIEYETYFSYRLDSPHPSHSSGNLWVVADIIASYCTYTQPKVYTLANGVKGTCVNSNNNEEIVDALLSYVQDRGSASESIRYISDGIDDFAKYPIETLAEGCGDCEDKSILFLSMVKALGYSCALFIITGHAFAGVHLTNPPTHNSQVGYWYVLIDGLAYYTCETTMDGWKCGDLPEACQGEPVYYEIIN